MMRELTNYIINPANGRLSIAVLDEPGHSGVCHEYMIEAGEFAKMLHIKFQNGPINEHGINGVTHEALIAILCDRLAGFQNGPYANDDNAIAMGHLMAAQAALQRRTKARMERGVEGTHAI
jgi:hypothetical protein